MTTPEDAPNKDIHILDIMFNYTIQIVPRKINGSDLQRHLHFKLELRVPSNTVDTRGYPDPRALWYAERMFLEAIARQLQPNTRLIAWKACMQGDAFVLSEYRVLLPSSAA